MGIATSSIITMKSFVFEFSTCSAIVSMFAAYVCSVFAFVLASLLLLIQHAQVSVSRFESATEREGIVSVRVPVVALVLVLASASTNSNIDINMNISVLILV